MRLMLPAFILTTFLTLMPDDPAPTPRAEATYSYNPALTLVGNATALFDVVTEMHGPSSFAFSDDKEFITWYESVAAGGGMTMAAIQEPHGATDHGRISITRLGYMNKALGDTAGVRAANEYNLRSLATSCAYLASSHCLVFSIVTDIDPITADEIQNCVARSMFEQTRLIPLVAEAVGLRDPTNLLE